MNKEDYVSLKVAKLLKQKGFDEPCEYYISKNTSQVFYKDRLKPFKKTGHIIFPCPTLYEAQKWIMKQNLYVYGDLYGTGWYWVVKNVVNGNMICSLFDKSDKIFSNNQECLNAGFLKALKLIK